MIFRVNETTLNRVKTKIRNEDEFLKKNSSKFTKFIKVERKNLPKTVIKTDEVFYKLDDNKIAVDEERTQAQAEKYFLKQQNNLLKELQELADNKTQEVFNMLAGQEVTESQLNRYKQKEVMAKAYLNDGSFKDNLQIEADLVGISVDDFATLIVNTADEYNAKSDYFISLIEAFRVKCKTIIKSGDLELAKTLLSKARRLDSTATPTDIKDLFDTGGK